MNVQTKSVRYTRISTKEKKFFSTREALTDTNFQSFYVKYRHFIDKLIATWSYSYQNKYDMEDIRQEVLFRLQVNNVLKQYNPALSQFNTFLTSKIKNYVRHVVRDIDASEPFWLLKTKGKTEKQKAEIVEFHESMHGACEDDFEDISLNTALSKLRNRIKPELWEFACKLQEGWTISEIAREKRLSRTCVAFKYMRALKSKANQRLFNKG